MDFNLDLPSTLRRQIRMSNVRDVLTLRESFTVQPSLSSLAEHRTQRLLEEGNATLPEHRLLRQCEEEYSEMATLEDEHTFGQSPIRNVDVEMTLNRFENMESVGTMSHSQIPSDIPFLIPYINLEDRDNHVVCSPLSNH